MEENKIKYKSLKLGLLGDSAVGKTCICDAIMNVEFREK